MDKSEFLYLNDVVAKYGEIERSLAETKREEYDIADATGFSCWKWMIRNGRGAMVCEPSDMLARFKNAMISIDPKGYALYFTDNRGKVLKGGLFRAETDLIAKASNSGFPKLSQTDLKFIRHIRNTELDRDNLSHKKKLIARSLQSRILGGL